LIGGNQAAGKPLLEELTPNEVTGAELFLTAARGRWI
jgi:hypothetical protein